MRGRLIQRFMAEVLRLDRDSTSTTDPDGTGPLDGGYDTDFREPVFVDDDGDGLGESSRQEMDAVRIPCQIEPRAEDGGSAVGEASTLASEMKLVFHFRDLERLGLVGTDGRPLIGIGDRLAGIYQRNGTMVQEFVDPSGMFVTRLRTTGWGMNRSRPTRNLLLVDFDERKQGAARIKG